MLLLRKYLQNFTQLQLRMKSWNLRSNSKKNSELKMANMTSNHLINPLENKIAGLKIIVQ